MRYVPIYIALGSIALAVMQPAGAAIVSASLDWSQFHVEVVAKNGVPPPHFFMHMLLSEIGSATAGNAIPRYTTPSWTTARTSSAHSATTDDSASMSSTSLNVSASSRPPPLDVCCQNGGYSEAERSALLVLDGPGAVVFTVPYSYSLVGNRDDDYDVGSLMLRASANLYDSRGDASGGATAEQELFPETHVLGSVAGYGTFTFGLVAANAGTGKLTFSLSASSQTLNPPLVAAGSTVPEPAGYVAIAFGLAAIGCRARRRRGFACVQQTHSRSSRRRAVLARRLLNVAAACILSGVAVCAEAALISASFDWSRLHVEVSGGAGAPAPIFTFLNKSGPTQTFAQTPGDGDEITHHLSVNWTDPLSAASNTAGAHANASLSAATLTATGSAGAYTDSCCGTGASSVVERSGRYRVDGIGIVVFSLPYTISFLENRTDSSDQTSAFVDASADFYSTDNIQGGDTRGSQSFSYQSDRPGPRVVTGIANVGFFAGGGEGTGGLLFKLSVNAANMYRSPAVPEPSTYVVLCAGLMALTAFARRRAAGENCNRTGGVRDIFAYTKLNCHARCSD